ncbi:flavodoxin family protein [Pedobacter frigiditerrae]|uniref:flavodoxin family protein n=1 Tax=Pedobacter frigiditerrae TaxID=2530452 RepID=UPI002931B3C2|nr:flavodoxin [Pedobacter frigiditerrae]
MKVAQKYLLILVLISGMISGANAQSSSIKDKKVLIVYLTRTKNTEAVAQRIQKEVGGKLIGLELVTPYPENYGQHVAQVVKENNSNYLPPLKTKIDSVESYDLIFIGFPTWGMKIPPPMKTFLKQYNFSGKTIIPFNTNAGYGVGSGFEIVKQLCPSSTVLEGYSTTGGIERDGVKFVMQGDKEKMTADELKTWLQKIKLIK